MIGLRLRAVIAVLALVLVASSQGCGTNDGRDGPPFEPGDIAGPRSLQITNSDIEGVGRSTPYGTVLGWWQALQRKDVAGVQRSYAGRIGRNAARRQIHALQSPRSQPINPLAQSRKFFLQSRISKAGPGRSLRRSECTIGRKTC